MVTHGWSAAILCGLWARKRSHKEFSFLLVAIKCLSIFIVCDSSCRLLNELVFFYVLRRLAGGDGGSEEGAQWSRLGLPASSSDRNG